MWTKSMSTLLCLILILALVNLADAVPYQLESWNDPDPLDLGPGEHSPPAGGENLWAYWDEDFEPDPQEGSGYNYHHHPMPWSATGGVDNSGYAWTPLVELMSEHNELKAHWPAFLTDQQTTYYDYHYPGKAPPRDLDLTVDNAYITVSLLDRELVSTSSTPPGPVDLAGGKIYFFVGHWWHNDPDDLTDDAFIFFYNANDEFDVTGNDWTTSFVPVGEGTALEGDWPVIASSEGLPGYEDPPLDGDEAYEHFISPQQWGFVIYNELATVAPIISGELGFDNFAVVPEPCTALLLLFAFGSVAVWWRWR